MKISKGILEQTEHYFVEKIDQFGTTVRGLDWNSNAAQNVRFEQLTRLFHGNEEPVFTICDYGCGFGDYFGFLKDRGYCFQYTGMDIVEKSVACAKQKYGTEAAFINGANLDRTFDYIVESGIFNIKGDVSYEEWTRYVTGIIEEFHRHSKKGFAFNCLTSYSDVEYMKEHLYYADPLYFFDYAKKHFSRNVALLHDYDLYDFTILVRK